MFEQQGKKSLCVLIYLAYMTNCAEFGWGRFSFLHIVVGMEIYLQYMLEAVLINQECFSYC